MAVTNANLAEQLNQLNEEMRRLEENLEQKLSFVSSPGNADDVLGRLQTITKSLNYLEMQTNKNHPAFLERLDKIEHDLRVLAGPPRPRAKTMREKLSDLLAQVMGTPAR